MTLPANHGRINGYSQERTSIKPTLANILLNGIKNWSYG